MVNCCVKNCLPDSASRRLWSVWESNPSQQEFHLFLCAARAVCPILRGRRLHTISPPLPSFRDASYKLWQPLLERIPARCRRCGLLVEHPLPAFEILIVSPILSVQPTVKLESSVGPDLDSLKLFRLSHVHKKDILRILTLLITDDERRPLPWASLRCAGYRCRLFDYSSFNFHIMFVLFP